MSVETLASRLCRECHTGKRLHIDSHPLGARQNIESRSWSSHRKLPVGLSRKPGACAREDKRLRTGTHPQGVMVDAAACATTEVIDACSSLPRMAEQRGRTRTSLCSFKISCRTPPLHETPHSMAQDEDALLADMLPQMTAPEVTAG
jgi:hypothetical protein